MSSSDSEDDCYGHVAQKLQTIKNTYHSEPEPGIPNISSDQNNPVNLEDSLKNETNPQGNAIVDANTSINSTDNDELTLDAIIANNTKGKTRGRGKRKNTEDNDDNTSPARVTRSSRRKTSDSTQETATQLVPSQGNQENTRVPTRRGRGRGGSRARGTTRTPRGRNRGRGRAWLFPDALYPIFSVGNTDEYPDMCDDQQLFATKSNDDVVVLDEGDPLEDDNEELSVKVYWRSLEVFRFKIRKYQKLTQIFEYFSKKEKVGNDKLLFTYKDRILKIDDTPDTINYNIAKFIDGGIVNQNVMDLLKNTEKSTVNDGIKIKFQCQNVKKPYETRVRPEEKLASAMMKYAEHIEKPMEKLKFYFDGDLINGKSTANDLELEGGECIDVKLSS